GGYGMRRDLQINHQTISNVASSTLQPVMVITVAVQIVAPCLAPEGGDKFSAFHDYRRQDGALLAQFSGRSLSLAPPFGDRDVGGPCTFVEIGHGLHSFIAAFRSR